MIKYLTEYYFIKKLLLKVNLYKAHEIEIEIYINFNIQMF